MADVRDKQVLAVRRLVDAADGGSELLLGLAESNTEPALASALSIVAEALVDAMAESVKLLDEAGEGE